MDWPDCRIRTWPSIVLRRTARLWLGFGAGFCAGLFAASCPIASAESPAVSASAAAQVITFLFIAPIPHSLPTALDRKKLRVQIKIRLNGVKRSFEEIE